VRVVALDQVAPGETYGEFTPDLAHWLDHTLSAAPQKPTIVALHHPPFLTHDLLFDRIGLKGAELFASVISAHPQVCRIVCGHHHRVVLGQVAHAPAVVAPSTSWTYGLAAHTGQPLAPRTDEQPGWMLHVWAPASGLASHAVGL
jgi:3',5'-cyclic AMP phosphodiesterase CpdA